MAKAGNAHKLINARTLALVIVVAVIGLSLGFGGSIFAMKLYQQFDELAGTEQGFLVYIIVMTSLAVFLLLVMFVLVEMRMNRIMSRLDDISESASQFVKLGAEFAKKSR